MNIWTDQIWGVMQSDRNAHIDSLLKDPLQRKLMLCLRGMFEFEARNTPDPPCYQLIHRVTAEDRPFLEPALAFLAWSIDPSHFKEVDGMLPFDLSPIQDLTLFLKIMAEAADDGHSMQVVLPETAKIPTEQRLWAAEFASMRRHGTLDLTVQFLESGARLTVSQGDGRLHFPKVNKADLHFQCPACKKRNKDTAVNCFGCKRTLNYAGVDDESKKNCKN